jgi:hypothetical protein
MGGATTTAAAANQQQESKQQGGTFTFYGKHLSKQAPCVAALTCRIEPFSSWSTTEAKEYPAPPLSRVTSRACPPPNRLPTEQRVQQLSEFGAVGGPLVRQVFVGGEAGLELGVGQTVAHKRNLIGGHASMRRGVGGWWGQWVGGCVNRWVGGWWEGGWVGWREKGRIANNNSTNNLKQQQHSDAPLSTRRGARVLRPRWTARR